MSDFSWRQGGNQRKNIIGILNEPPNAKWKPPQHLYDKISHSWSWRQESVETFQPSCLQIQIMQLHLPSLGKLWKSCCFAKELILFLQSLDHWKEKVKRMDSFRILKFETAKQSKQRFRFRKDTFFIIQLSHTGLAAQMRTQVTSETGECSASKAVTLSLYHSPTP